MRPGKNVGAAANSEKLSAFEMACDWLENQIEIVTVSKLCDKMREFNNSSENYNTRWVKHLLQKKYGVSVKISSSGKGKEDMIMFESKANNNVEQNLKYIKGNYSSSIDRLVNIVGNVILEEIKGKEKSDFYPSPYELNDDSEM